MAHGGEGKLLDNSHQTPQTRAHDTQDFECDLGMSQTQRLEVLFADEEQSGIIDGRHRRRIIPSIKHRQFRDGTPGPIYAEHVLAARQKSS